MRFNALFKPKTKSPNPLRERYEKITRFSQAFFKCEKYSKASI
ncbi:hypothetical protein HMPREF1421_00603 [Helicobacter pylori GAM265BSii]|uniref:Uncharacterized protein n=1 Tax=Helicobacter pylori GAM265BSii TaxID=1159049 RepID=M3R9J3_HELPX|nr:hypothetical protein HMPREF1421_00603 [Helicobacter pylori GAM265BSii]